jgi:hypothetical protein
MYPSISFQDTDNRSQRHKLPHALCGQKAPVFFSFLFFSFLSFNIRTQAIFQFPKRRTTSPHCMSCYQQPGQKANEIVVVRSLQSHVHIDSIAQRQKEQYEQCNEPLICSPNPHSTTVNMTVETSDTRSPTPPRPSPLYHYIPHS